MRTRIAALAIAILFVLPIAGRCVELNLNTPAPTPLPRSFRKPRCSTCRRFR